MEKNTNQFVIYPHNGNNQNISNLTPQDKLIYLAIRRYMNKDNMEAFPSYARLTQDIGASSKTLKKCINNLVSEGYITTFKKGRSIVYKFNNKKQFEPFSYEFLDNKNLSFTEKSYIVASQQHMFKDKNSEEGVITYQNKELAKLINMSESTISRCNHSLKEKNYLEITAENEKKFQLRELDQLFVWKFKEQDEKIQQNTEDIAKIKYENEQMKLRLSELEKQLKIQTELNVIL